MQAGGKRIAQGPGARPVRLLTMRKIAVALLIVTLGSGCAGVNRQVRKAIGDREPKLWFAGLGALVFVLLRRRKKARAAA